MLVDSSTSSKGSNMIDIAMCLFYQHFGVSQASYYPCTVSFLVDWHILIHETTYLPSELLSVTFWKSENAIVKGLSFNFCIF